MAPLPPREQRNLFLRYQGLEYTDADIATSREGMPELMRDGLFARMVMEHRDDAGVVVFTSQAWGRLFDTRGPLSQETFELEAVYYGLGLIPGERGCPSFARGVFLLMEISWTPPSYTLIRDPMLRLCHRIMAHSIAGRSQAPKKICEQLDDTWAWVAIGPERQPDVAASAATIAEDAPVVDKGDQAVLAPVQAPQQPPPPPPAAARTMP
ncbi:hypothetical protein Tco_0772055 [Tanacetum coccineum]|uniref:Uncharacterized protein n=1 Tax=Tanacetum coccineum TaxID=301880 RepID=A0ABQ4ZGU9_9ASTR